MKESYFSENEKEYINILVKKYCNISSDSVEYFSIKEYGYLQYLIHKYYNIDNANLKYLTIEMINN